MNRLVIVALTLAVVPVAAALAPEPRDDFGDAWFGFEQDPPAVEPIDLDLDAVGQLLQIDLTGLAATDDFSMLVGGMALKGELLPDGTLELLMVGGDQRRDLSLPPLPDGTSTDLTVLVTPVTVAIDRVGDNGAAFPDGDPLSWGNIDPTKIRDVTVTTWGMMDDLTAGSIVKPDTVTATTTRLDYNPGLDNEIVSFIVDPENQVQRITSDTDYPAAVLAAVDAATPATTKAAIESALDAIAIEDLTLNGVLDSLSTAVEEVGAVDLTNLAENLELHGLGVKTVTNGLLDAATYLDYRNLTQPNLVFLNGGLGKIALEDAVSGQISDSLVAGLKDPDSVEDVAFHFLNKNEVVQGMATFYSEATVGNYRTLITQHIAALQRNVDVHVVEDLADCDARLSYDSSPGVPQTLCGSPLNSKKVVSTVMEFTERIGCPKQGTSTPPVCDDPVGFIGSTSESLKKWLPDDAALHNTSKRGLVGPVRTPGGVGGVGGVPSGIGNVDGLHGLGDTPTLDAPSVKGVDPDLLDAIAEHFSVPVLPEINPIVPLDPATGWVSAVMDLAGNGITGVPLDLLKLVPLGTDAQLNLRFVGAPGSLGSGTGIQDVVATLTAKDPLGLGTVQSVSTSNANGYAVFTVPALGGWSVTGTHDDYQEVEGSGSAGGPGQTTGQQYTMKSQSGSELEDKARDNLLLIIAIVALVGLLWYHRKGGRKKGGRTK